MNHLNNKDLLTIIFSGIPCLAYGIAATFLIRHTEIVETPYGPIKIYFLYAEDKGSEY